VARGLHEEKERCGESGGERHGEEVSDELVGDGEADVDADESPVGVRPGGLLLGEVGRLLQF